MEHVERVKEEFNALLLEKVESLKYGKFSFNTENLDEDHLIVQVKAAGIGAFDLLYYHGKNTCEKNIPIGTEGTGIVLKVESNCDQSLVGKRIAFITHPEDKKGVCAYSEIAVVNKQYIAVLHDDIDFNSGVYLLANPLTAKCLMVDQIRHHKAVVFDTASSALIKMLIKLCYKEGIKTICIVRKDENIKPLLDIGANVCLNSKSTDFYKDLSKSIEEIVPSLYVTCLGGDFPSRILTHMPRHSTMCVVGNLTIQNLSGFSSTDFIFLQKKIVGFQFFNYIKTIESLEFEKHKNEILESYSNGEDTFKVNIVKEFNFKEIDEALKLYESVMSNGKVILKP